jgi:hypothetical protein
VDLALTITMLNTHLAIFGSEAETRGRNGTVRQCEEGTEGSKKRSKLPKAKDEMMMSKSDIFGLIPSRECCKN